MLDPDEPGGTFTHWLVYRIPPGITSLAVRRDAAAGRGRGGDRAAAGGHLCAQCLLRHPAVLAQDLATLDVLSSGRLEIGLRRVKAVEATGIIAGYPAEVSRLRAASV